MMKKWKKQFSILFFGGISLMLIPVVVCKVLLGTIPDPIGITMIAGALMMSFGAYATVPNKDEDW